MYWLNLVYSFSLHVKCFIFSKHCKFINKLSYVFTYFIFVYISVSIFPYYAIDTHHLVDFYYYIV